MTGTGGLLDWADLEDARTTDFGSGLNLRDVPTADSGFGLDLEDVRTGAIRCPDTYLLWTPQRKKTYLLFSL